jgi:hypothetical protein
MRLPSRASRDRLFRIRVDELLICLRVFADGHRLELLSGWLMP